MHRLSQPLQKSWNRFFSTLIQVLGVESTLNRTLFQAAQLREDSKSKIMQKSKSNNSSIVLCFMINQSEVMKLLRKQGAVRLSNHQSFVTWAGAQHFLQDCIHSQRRLISITKTCLYNFDPLNPHFYIVKLGFTGVYIIFLISAQKHRLWVLVRTASTRRF